MEKQQKKGYTNELRQTKMLGVMIMLIGFISILPLVSAVDYNTPTAYWKFNEVSGNATDSSLNLYTLTNTNTVRYLAGKLNNSANFTGGNYFNGTANTTLSLEKNNFTIAFWVKFNSSTPEALFYYGDSYTCGNYYLKTNDGASISWVYPGCGPGNLGTTGSFTDNQWHRIVYVRNGTGTNQFAVWVDGTLKNVQTNVISFNNASMPATKFFIGNSSDAPSFHGSLDDFRIYNGYAFTPTEIATDYNSGAGTEVITFAQQISLISPTNGMTSSNLGENFIANFNIARTNFNYTWRNATYYIWYTNLTVFNSTLVSLSGNNTQKSLFIDSFVTEDFKWNIYGCYANNTFSNCTWASSNYTFNTIPFTILAETYNTQTLEGSTELFALNLSFLSGQRLSSINLIYNNTYYLGNFIETSTDNYYVSRSIVAPNVAGNTNIPFYWSLKLEDNSVINSTSHNQSIDDFGIDDCSVYTNQMFNISLFDEESRTFLAGNSQNTSMKLSFNLATLLGISVLNYSHYYNMTNPARLCLQNPLNSSTYRLDGLIEYSSLGRFTEFYNFQNYSLKDSTNNVQIYLYDLNSSKGQEFKVTYKDSNFVPISGAILNIQRKYIETGNFLTTEIPKTNSEGYTIAHLIKSDVIYNIIVIKEGVAIATFTDIVANCQNPTFTTCQINLNSFGSSNLPSDFTNLNDISYTLTWNKTGRIISVLYSIISGITSQVDLNVTLFDSLGNTTVCSDGLYSSGGTLSCIVPGSFGNSTIIVHLYKDGVIVGQSIISLAQNPSDIYGKNIIFIALFMFLIVIGIGASSDNPMAMGISLIIGAIVLIALNIIYSQSWIGAGATVLWFIMGVILVLIKGSSRQ